MKKRFTITTIAPNEFKALNDNARCGEPMKHHGGKRKGAGRPVTTGGGTQVAIRLDGHTLQKLDALALTAKQTRSEVIRSLIQNAQ